MKRLGRIVVWDDDEVDDSLWMPLIVFLARAKDEDVHPAFVYPLDFRDFMLMHGVERKPRPFLYVYKHVESRRYLAVDRDGSPYRFLPSGENGQYRTSTFHRAIWQLNPIFIRDARAFARRGGASEDDDRELEEMRRWSVEDEERRARSEEAAEAAARHLRLVR